jgi:hypothetical protein
MGVENRLHWVLDVIFREDRARFRTGHGPQNMAIVRDTALNLLSRDKAQDQLEEPSQARRRVECQLPRNYHPTDRMTFKRFPCGGSPRKIPTISKTV